MKPTELDTARPAPVLGTAMWGWTVPAATAHGLLDDFYAAGGRWIDAATNYPINRRPEDWRRAEQILEDWIGRRGVADLKIIMKVGSQDNLRSPDHNLSPGFLQLSLDNYRSRFGANLACLMIHWDNRSDAAAIGESLSVMKRVRQYGIRPGLSGIRHPEVYAAHDPGEQDWLIECKHNLLQSDYTRYAPLHHWGRVLAYGLNAGGLKLAVEGYGESAGLLARGGVDRPGPARRLQQWIGQLPAGQRPCPNRMNHLALIEAWTSGRFAGLLIGPSRPDQLADSLSWWAALHQYDYSDWGRQLRELDLES